MRVLGLCSEHGYSVPVNNPICCKNIKLYWQGLLPYVFKNVKMTRLQPLTSLRTLGSEADSLPYTPDDAKLFSLTRFASRRENARLLKGCYPLTPPSSFSGIEKDEESLLCCLQFSAASLVGRFLL